MSLSTCMSVCVYVWASAVTFPCWMSEAETANFAPTWITPCSVDFRKTLMLVQWARVCVYFAECKYQPYIQYMQYLRVQHMVCVRVTFRNNVKKKREKREKEKKKQQKQKMMRLIKAAQPQSVFFGCKKASYFLATLLCTHWSLERMHEHFQEWFCHIGWERAAQETCGLSPLRHCRLPKRRENVFKNI